MCSAGFIYCILTAKKLIFRTGHVTLLMSSYWWKWEALGVFHSKCETQLLHSLLSGNRVNRNQTGMFVVLLGSSCVVQIIRHFLTLDLKMSHGICKLCLIYSHRAVEPYNIKREPIIHVTALINFYKHFRIINFHTAALSGPHLLYYSYYI